MNHDKDFKLFIQFCKAEIHDESIINNLPDFIGQNGKVKDYLPFVNLTLSSPDFLDFILQGMLSIEERIQFYCARVIQLTSDRKMNLFINYEEILIESLRVHSAAVKRTSLRIFMKIPLKEKYHTKLINSTMKILFDTSETIACRAFSAHVLSRLTEIYPELANEIIPFLEQRMHLESSGMKSVSKKYILKHTK